MKAEVHGSPASLAVAAAPPSLSTRLGRAIQKHWQPSITHCLFVSLFPGVALVWAAVYGLGLAQMLWPVSGGFDQEIANAGQGVLRSIEQQSDLTAVQHSLAAALVFDREVNGQRDLTNRITVWSAKGEWIGGNTGRQPTRVKQDKRLGFFDVESDGRTYRANALCAQDCAYRIETMQARDDRLREFNRVMLSPASLLFPLIIVLPLFLVLTVVTMRGALKPLSDLSDELATRTPGDLRPVTVSWEFASELKPIIRAINTTFGGLEALRQRERNFLADAAHEIRTPLAVISAQVDTLLRTSELAEKVIAADRLRGGMARASRLVNQLLQLARLDAEADHQVVRIDLASVARDCLAACEPEARMKSIELAYEGPDHLTLTSPGYALESIVSNLVGNAVRYGYQGGRVEIQMTALTENRLRLRVCDDGPGIPTDQLPTMFERFRRGSTQNEISGSGLGLPIVESAARQLCATLDVQPGLQNRGICFSIEWSPAGAVAGQSETS